MAVGASFGARLEHLRARKGTKETELAKVFGINRSTIGRILKGETEKVSSQLAIDTAQYFGVSTDFLLGLTDMPDSMNHPMEKFKLTEGAAILFYPKSAILNRVATEIFCVTQNRNCSPGLGAGSLNKQKTTRFPGWKTGGLCQSGYQVALLAHLLFSAHS